MIGAPNETERDLANLRLLEYGFSRYRRQVPIRAGAELAEASVRYQGGELPLRAARTVTAGVRPDQRLGFAVRAPSEVEGPIRRGAVLGHATVFVDGRRVAAVPLRAGRAVPTAGALDRARSFLGTEEIPIGIALCVILVGAAMLRRLSR